MKQWHVKELSHMAGVSIQTLYLYDRINLLKPSIRQNNGYRLYLEKDLLKLQQIVALKFLGFNLDQITKLLNDGKSVRNRFLVQKKLLEAKAKNLLDACQIIRDVTAKMQNDDPLPVETIMHLMEVYKMMKNIEECWIKEILTPDEIEQYAEFQSGMRKRFTEKEHENFEKDWENLILKVTAILILDFVPCKHVTHKG